MCFPLCMASASPSSRLFFRSCLLACRFPFAFALQRASAWRKEKDCRAPHQAREPHGDWQLWLPALAAASPWPASKGELACRTAFLYLACLRCSLGRASCSFRHLRRTPLSGLGQLCSRLRLSRERSTVAVCTLCRASARWFRWSAYFLYTNPRTASRWRVSASLLQYRCSTWQTCTGGCCTCHLGYRLGGEPQTPRHCSQRWRPRGPAPPPPPPLPFFSSSQTRTP